MAITATIALSSATCNAEQTVVATVTVTNTGASTVLVTGIQPLVTPHSATNGSVSVAVGSVPLGGAFPSTVAGSSGTTKFSFPVTPHAPNTSYGILAEPASFVYDVGAVVATSDGSLTSPTVTTLTVAYPAN